MEAARLMKMASVMDSPSDRVPTEASRWDHERTEACSGDNIILGLALGFLEFREFIALELGQMEACGSHKIRCSPRLSLCPTTRYSGLPPKLLGSLLVHEKSP